MPGTPDILFFDLEVHKKTKQILEIGAILRGDQFRNNALPAFVRLARQAAIFCGHNIVDHDLPILKEKLAEHLRVKGFQAKAYHGQLDSDVKKMIQEAFMDDENDLDVIVATSAFGMGVDKHNVKMVIHYQISDSLENYMQESGRAGRNPELRAKCFILFDEEDLSGHFQLLNTSKLNYKEINQIWQGIKRFKKRSFTKSALEIAKEAGWDTELYQLGNRVKTAISGT